MTKISFSVVTTCRNEMKSLPRWKQNMIDQTRQPDEIVVVDAFSDDGTFEYLTEWAAVDKRIKVIQAKGNAAIGRNLAIENAKNEHILSTDMGVRLNNIWCEELIMPFEKDVAVEVVAGNSCYDVESISSAIAWAEYFIERGGFIKVGEGFEPGNRSVAYKKELWVKLGKLPEDLTFYGDDQTFGRQMIQEKVKFAYAPQAMTFWGRPKHAEQFFREMFNYGKGDGEALIKVPKAFKLFRDGKIGSSVVPFLSGTFNLIKSFRIRYCLEALRNKKFSSVIYIPYLLFFRGYYHSKGYLIGFEIGSKNCLDCRSRLNRDKNGYPIN